MKLLDADKIIHAINYARHLYQKGKLDHRVSSITNNLFWISKKRSTVDNKKLLINMAKNKEPRPGKKHPLYIVFCQYINKNNPSYDCQFDKKIRKLAPNWFISKTNTTKQQLIKMAKNGYQRPVDKKSFLGTALCNYIQKTSSSYDAKFDKEIRKLAPNWFINTSMSKKQQLIKMAQNGDKRPVDKASVLGTALCNYIQKTSSSYDAKFDKQIRKLAPHWFINPSISKKEQLIQLARKGEKRPVFQKHPLGSALCNYVQKTGSTYDANFDKQIRKLAPHWFRK